MSEDLFGNTVEDKSSPDVKKRRETNDMSTIITVLQRACDKEAGYALLGPTQHVHRCGPPHQRADREATQAIHWEAAAVHQLITSGHLKVGGQHSYSTRRGQRSGTAVLVPQATRALLARWTALKPLPSNDKNQTGG